MTTTQTLEQSKAALFCSTDEKPDIGALVWNACNAEAASLEAWREKESAVKAMINELASAANDYDLFTAVQQHVWDARMVWVKETCPEKDATLEAAQEWLRYHMKAAKLEPPKAETKKAIEMREKRAAKKEELDQWIENHRHECLIPEEAAQQAARLENAGNKTHANRYAALAKVLEKERAAKQAGKVDAQNAAIEAQTLDLPKAGFDIVAAWSELSEQNRCDVEIFIRNRLLKQKQSEGGDQGESAKEA